jgi:hypothetical protein
VLLDMRKELVFGGGVEACARKPGEARGFEDAAAAPCFSGASAAVVIWGGRLGDEVQKRCKEEEERDYCEGKFVAAEEVWFKAEAWKGL